MKKYLWLSSLALAIVLGGAGCTKLNTQVPTNNSTSSTVSTPSAGVTTTPSNPVSRRYKANGPDVCARIKFACEPGEHYFSDAGGCGCELDDPKSPTTLPLKDNSKDQTMCYDLYKPVCGEKTVYCIKAPCPPIKETYPNDCYAKRDGAANIVEGVCPEK
jgi:hypothetical protein